MKTLFVTLMVALMAGSLLMPEIAEAKRFGGGKSFGKQYNTTPRQATSPSQASAAGQRQPAPGQAAPKSGASRWLGPLAGLAAGGLLASMLFGDGFEGFQIMDFLMIAALVFGGFMLFKMFRNRAAGPAVAGAGAGRGYAGGQSPFGGMPGGAASPAATAVAPSTGTTASDAPAWFDDAGFVDGAKTHFIRLQAAWDQSDFRDIREYTAPQLFAEIKREREALGDAPNYTEVVTLNAELLSVQRDGDQVVASVRFTGLIREEESGAAKPLDEIWHVAHDWTSPDGDWLISGIQQTS
jgi:predicted lipid-binding transport protein (Tim44 family)